MGTASLCLATDHSFVHLIFPCMYRFNLSESHLLHSHIHLFLICESTCHRLCLSPRNNYYLTNVACSEFILISPDSDQPVIVTHWVSTYLAEHWEPDTPLSVPDQVSRCICKFSVSTSFQHGPGEWTVSTIVDILQLAWHVRAKQRLMRR